MSKHKKHPHHSADQLRRNQFQAQSGRRVRVSPTLLVAAVAVVFGGVLVYLVASGSKVSAQPITDIAGSGTDVSLPVSEFPDDTAKFYRYTTAAGRQLRFFVMRSADGVIRAAFDACDVCYRERKGYHQERDDMVCNNCGRHFPSTRLNVSQGGCNPAPLDRTMRGDRVLLSAAALAAGADYF
jgi:uncharacterized membrane protein